MKKIFVYFSVICVISLFSSSVWAITISFDPSDSSIKIGESINVDINISGLSDTNLSGFDFNLEYDGTLLSFDSYVFGDQLGEVGIEALDISIDENLVELSTLWDFSFQADSFTIATLTFTGIGIGESLFSIQDLVLSDDSCPALELVHEDINSASISVEPVPEPGTIFLLGIGLIGITGFMKKRHLS